MSRGLVVTIDGETYRVDEDRRAEDALADFRRLMREGALDELILPGGRRMVVNWGRVTAVSVTEDEGRDEGREEGLTYSAEPRWPQRPF
jgi:hypothetical protein